MYVNVIGHLSSDLNLHRQILLDKNVTYSAHVENPLTERHRSKIVYQITYLEANHCFHNVFKIFPFCAWFSSVDDDWKPKAMDLFSAQKQNICVKDHLQQICQTFDSALHLYWHFRSTDQHSQIPSVNKLYSLQISKSPWENLKVNCTKTKCITCKPFDDVNFFASNY